MRHNRWIQIVGALFLIGAGIIFMLQNLEILPNLASLFWALLLIAGGVFFLGAFFLGRAHWWTLIVAGGMGGAGLTTLLATLGAPGEVAAALLFICLGGAFAGIYLLDRRLNWWAIIPGGAMAALALGLLLAGLAGGEAFAVVFFLGLGVVFIALYFAPIAGRRRNWWAIIPAGALLSLALVVLFSSVGDGSLAGSMLFLGLGATFGVLYLMRGPEQHTGWAWIPAAALLVFGAFILFVSGAVAYGGIFWSLVLIILGLFLIYRQMRSPRV